LYKSKEAGVSLPSIGGALGSRSKLKLHAVNAVDTVDKQYQNKDKCDLERISKDAAGGENDNTFIQYCNFAIRGLSEMKVRSLRFQVKGIGTMSDMKTTISKTRSPKTCCETSR